jgi:hypothetical protein
VAFVLLLPAVFAYRRGRTAAPWAQAPLGVASALPLAFAAAAAVRWYELDRWEPLTLPWDAGLVAPWVSAALSALALGTILVFLRRRPAPG